MIFLYQILLFFLRILISLLAPFNNKLKESIKLRKKWNLNKIQTEWEKVKQENYPNSNPNNNIEKKIFWFHASSVGEWEQAKPALALLKKNYNSLIVASYFSPSVSKMGTDKIPADFIFPLPFDFSGRQKRLVATIKPHALIIVKYDAWLNLLRAAKNRNVFIAMLSATFGKKSGRANFFMSSFNRKVFSHFSYIACVSEEDKKQIANYYNPQEKGQLENIGDTRFDRVWELLHKAKKKRQGDIRKKTNKNDTSQDKTKNENLKIVAGSTYEKSEKILIQALLKLKQQVKENQSNKKIKLILVPHEIDNKHIEGTISMCKQNNINYKLIQNSKSLQTILYQNETNDNTQVYIIQMLGVLIDLYSLADIVFIGGSFQGSIHSVLEGAVYSKAIITGPYMQNSPEAQEMEREACLVKANSEKQFISLLQNLVNDKALRDKLAGKAGKFVKDRTGATQKFVDRISNIT